VIRAESHDGIVQLTALLDYLEDVANLIVNERDVACVVCPQSRYFFRHQRRRRFQEII
jgi:hypothetical protein